MELARRDPDVELVSVDSMQVYRGMDIGTAKPTPEEQREIPHHLIDMVDASHDYTVSEFQQAARNAIADIEMRGKRAILVGGTGLHLRAVIDGLELPGQFDDVRATLEAGGDPGALFARLQQLDPVAAARIEPDNRRRIVRALEVTIGSGRPFSSYGPGLHAYPEIPFWIVGVWLPREANNVRIAERVRKMVEDGWVDEAKRLHLSRTAAQALGYRELASHEIGSPLEPVVESIIARTRSFARRQRMWFRRDPRVNWFATSSDPANLVAPIARDYERWHDT
jgi:tRNA dimethylallyltransferase